MQFQLPLGIDDHLGLELKETVTCVSGEVGDEVAANNPTFISFAARGVKGAFG
jgi:hypothetical protein